MAMVGWHLEKIGDVDVYVERNMIFTALHRKQGVWLPGQR